MAAGLHGSARTTPRIRAALQAAKEGTRSLAARYGLNPKTVAKRRKRASTADAPMGPARPRGTTLTEAEEAISSSYGAAPSCRSMTSSAVYARPSQTSAARRYTAVWSATACPDCPATRRRPPSGAASSTPRSATSTSMFANCGSAPMASAFRLQKQAVRRRPPGAGPQAQAHPALHTAHQRQGRTVHSDLTTRMALRHALPQFRRARSRHARLALPLQQPQASLRPRRKATHQPIAQEHLLGNDI